MWSFRLEKLPAFIKCSNLEGRRSSHWEQVFPLSHRSDNRMSPGEERKSPAICRGKTAPDLPKQKLCGELGHAPLLRLEPGGTSARQVSRRDGFKYRVMMKSAALSLLAWAFPKTWSLRGGWPHFLTVNSWLALSPWEWNQPHLPLSRLPASTHQGRRCDTTSSLQPQLLFPLTSLDRSPQTQYSNDSSFVWVFIMGPRCCQEFAVICIMCGTVRKSNSWKQAENEIIPVIKLHFLHHHVTGKRDSWCFW